MSSQCAEQVYGHPTYQSLPTTTSIQKPGFSVQLPQGETWRVIHDTATDAAVARVGKHKEESYVISARGSKLPDLATPQAFQKLVDKQRAANTDPERFTVLSNKETLLENGPQGALCVRYETTAIDHHAHTAPSKYETMRTTNEGLACRSPYDPHVGVSIVYSYRYHPQDADKALPSKFDKLIATFRFEPVAGTAKDD